MVHYDDCNMSSGSEPWGIPVIDATPQAVLKHVMGAEDVLLARVRHNRLIDRLLNCVAHSLHTHLTFSSSSTGPITVGEIYHAVDRRGVEFVVAVQADNSIPTFGFHKATFDLEVCQALFPRLTPRFVNVELLRFVWGDVVVIYSLRHTKRGLEFEKECHFRLVPEGISVEVASQALSNCGIRRVK